GVLLDVTVLAGPLDPRGDVLAAWTRPLGELLLESLVGLGGEVLLAHSRQATHPDRFRTAARSSSEARRPKDSMTLWVLGQGMSSGVGEERRAHDGEPGKPAWEPRPHRSGCCRSPVASR